MFIFDAHLDLAMNALEWNRDLTWTIEEIRKSEIGMTDKPDRANNTVTLPAMRKGNIGLCVATQIARYVKKGSALPGWNSPQQLGHRPKDNLHGTKAWKPLAKWPRLQI